MPEACPARDFAIQVVRRLRDAGFETLFNGGCVRDLLLEREPGDYDVATSARPEQVRTLFGHRRTLAVGADFGVTVVCGPRGAGQVEVATFRTEGAYSDGRRPDSVEFSSPEQDARRRDFTINGMFFDPMNEEVIDYVGGERDLAARIVRAIGDPRQRMSEDKLRMLRAVRFAATLDFEIDTATANAVRDMADQIQAVSAERIAQELRRMLVHRHRGRAMQLARELGLLSVILPELIHAGHSDAIDHAFVEWDRTRRMLNELVDPRFELAAAILLHAVPGTAAVDRAAVIRTICRRLRLSNHETDDICGLVTRQDELVEAASLPLARLKRLLVDPLIREVLVLHRLKADAYGFDPAHVAFCENYLDMTPAEEIDPPPLISGDDLIGMGLQPGRRIGEILEAVRDAQLNGDIRTKNEAVQHVERLR